MRAGAARPDPTTENSTILAALDAQEADFTGWAFIDGGDTGNTFGDGGRERRVTTAPGRLATGRRAHPLAVLWREGLPTHRTGSGSAIVTRIVTRREGWVHR